MQSSMNDNPSVVVVIVNYCTAALTLDCLRSLEAIYRERADMRVVVADNASPDRSGEAIAEAIAVNEWHWARVLLLPSNGGFAYGNNAVICEFGTETAVDFFWLLNSDTIVRPGALDALIDFMKAEPRAGIAGSRLEDPDGTQQYSAFRFPTLASELEASARFGPLSRLLHRWAIAFPLMNNDFKVDWLAGASLLVRAEVFFTAGLMDEDYFLYFEETDFCRRAADAGWSAFFVANSRVAHLVGQSTGIVDGTQKPKRRPQYWFASRRRYFLKNHGLFYAMMADVALAVGTSFSRMREVLERRATKIPDKFFRDLARNFFQFQILRQSDQTTRLTRLVTNVEVIPRVGRRRHRTQRG